MKHFYKFIIIDKDEAKEDCPISDFEYDDYRYWGLYDMGAHKLIFFGDNIHNNGIEDEISAFLKGLDYADYKYSHETGYIVLDDLTYGVPREVVLNKLLFGEMIDEVL